MTKLLEMYAERLIKIQKRYEETNNKLMAKKEIKSVAKELMLWSKGL